MFGLNSVFVGSGGVTGLLLDTLSNAPAAAFGLDLQRTAYAGSCVRIRDNNSNAEADYGFVGGLFDSATPLAALTANGNAQGTTPKWYNQAVGGSDAVQATGTAQPIMFRGDPDVFLGGLQCSASPGRCLQGPVTLGTTSQFLCSIVIDSAAVSSYCGTISYQATGDADDNGANSFKIESDVGTMYASHNNVYATAAPSVSGGLHTITAYSDGSNVGICVDGGAAVTSAIGGSFGSTGTLTIGARNNGTNLYQGLIKAVLLVPAYSSSDRGKIETWLRSKYGTP